MKYLLLLAPLIVFSACSQAQNVSTNTEVAPVVVEDTSNEVVVSTESDLGVKVSNEPFEELAQDSSSEERVAETEVILPGQYLGFSEELFNQKQPKMLFFHATWCPSCRFVDQEIISRSAELPEGSLVLKVDYDSYKDLKKRYGVLSQHTFVLLDENNEKLDAERGGDFDDVLNLFLSES